MSKTRVELLDANFTTMVEINDWLEDMAIPYQCFWGIEKVGSDFTLEDMMEGRSTKRFASCYTFDFENAADAIHFKMRWVG